MNNIILISHPKTNLNFYKDLLKNYNFIISKKSYIDLIPISDLYLCGNSTTVSVAEICNKPIINLDFVNLDFSWIKNKKLKNVTNMNELYLILKKEIPVVEAKNQLSFKYLHIRYAKTGILDAFLESYIEDSKYSSIEFLDWVNTVYDRDKLKSSFKAYKLADIVNSLIAGRK